MTVMARIVVHSAGADPFPVLAALRDMLGAGSVLDVHRRLQSGPIEVGEWESMQAAAVARQLRGLGAAVTVELNASAAAEKAPDGW